MNDLSIMRTKCLSWLAGLLILLCFILPAMAQSKVVVIPLGGTKPTGDALETDVLNGKTFSNANATGLIGSRAPAPVAKTGVTHSQGPRDDGELKKGVPWPNPRFTDNSDGTVTDNLTGQVWLKNANCANGAINWADSISLANALHDGWTGDGSGGDCGLSDGSVAGDWRLPNIKELYSLFHLGFSGPALSNAAGTAKWSEGDAFSGVQVACYYWSSNYSRSNATFAWYVQTFYGIVDYYDKTLNLCMWPVRDQ